MSVRLKIIVHFVAVDIGSSGFELAKSMQTIPKMKPQIVAMSTRFVVSIVVPPIF
jgi:hypothetical protein